MKEEGGQHTTINAAHEDDEHKDDTQRNEGGCESATRVTKPVQCRQRCPHDAGGDAGVKGNNVSTN